jgi:hypothetical protein
MFNSEQNPEECDATDDAQGTVVRLSSLVTKKAVPYFKETAL